MSPTPSLPILLVQLKKLALWKTCLMNRRNVDGNEDLVCMGSGVKEEVEEMWGRKPWCYQRMVYKTICSLSIEMGIWLSCCHARGEIELGMPSGHFLKKKSSLHLKVLGLHAQMPCACAVVPATSVMQELGVCRAVDRRVHQCFHMFPAGVATQKTGKFSCLICSH